MAETSDCKLLQFGVEGMHCASCAARIERVLNRQQGVRSVAVNFASARASIYASPNQDEQLKAAVAKLGFHLTPLDQTPSVVEYHRQASQRLLRRLIGAAAFSLPVFVLAMAATAGPLSRWIQALLTTAVVFGFGAGFHLAALQQARTLGTNMDTLVSVGTLAAWGYSCWALFSGGAIFFETAAVIITLILFGRTLEARAKGRASDAVAKLLALGVRTVCVLRDGNEEALPIELLRVDDRFVVRPGEKVAADGVIEQGRSTFDESMVTGEATPVDKGQGDPVIGATINGPGNVVVRTTHVGNDTVLAQIVKLIEQAQGSKAPVQRLADRIASIFVPVVMSIAAVTLVAWWLFGPSFVQALTHAVAVLIIACPCALGLATPTAIMVGSGRGAELGVIFKGADSFETSRKVDTVLFDKTGTLTTGKMSLVDVLGDDPDEVLKLAAAVESGSEHPIARAVVAYAREKLGGLPPVSDFESITGHGVHGIVEDTKVMVGRRSWLIEQNVVIAQTLEHQLSTIEAQGQSVFLAAWDGQAHGLLAVADQPREGSLAAVAALRKQGVRVGLISGDNRRTAEAIAASLGIAHVLSEVLPADKVAEVRRLQQQGAVVAFVGDGINDAPALAQSNLGIAVGNATDVAMEAGHAVLMNEDPRTVATCLELARRTFRTIRRNLFWAFCYNVAAIPIAAAGLLNPMIASGTMALSSVSVVGSSLLLRRYRPH